MPPGHYCEYQECGKTFVSKATLKVHTRIHTGKKAFVCDFDGCEHTCSRSGDLVTHKRKHTGEKPFACDFDECDYRATASDGLEMHKRKHTGKRPHACDFDGCDYRTARSGDLARHKFTHTGERAHACDFDGCDYVCVCSCTLVAHKRIHTGEKPYECTQCEYVTSEIGNMSRHVRAMHSKHYKRIMKKKENRVCTYLTTAGFCLEREIHVAYSCFDTDKSFSRIDAVLEYPGRDLRVLLEVDETQHDGYTIACDVRRMNDTALAIRLAGTDASLLWVRFNPDAYSVDGERVRTPWVDRAAALATLLRTFEPRESGAMEIVYMYYDTVAGMPAICSAAEYDPSMAAGVSCIF